MLNKNQAVYVEVLQFQNPNCSSTQIQSTWRRQGSSNICAGFLASTEALLVLIASGLVHLKRCRRTEAGVDSKAFLYFPFQGNTPLCHASSLSLSYIPRNQKVTLQEWPSLKEVDSNPRLHGHPMTQRFWLLCLQKLLTDSPVAKYNLLFTVILILYIL